jgi:predicted transcriptional regulator YdeE
MNYETTNLPMFYIAGLAVRTINRGGQAAQDIGALWQQFTEGNFADKLEEGTNYIVCTPITKVTITIIIPLF